MDAARIATLRDSGRSWSEVCEETGLTKATAQHAFRSLPKNQLPSVFATATYSVLGSESKRLRVAFCIALFRKTNPGKISKRRLWRQFPVCSLCGH